METPEIGDLVRIKSVAGCLGEYKVHGINPYVKGQVGTVIPPMPHASSPEDHPWRVHFKDGYQGIRMWSYFAASELDLIVGVGDGGNSG